MHEFNGLSYLSIGFGYLMKNTDMVVINIVKNKNGL